MNKEKEFEGKILNKLLVDLKDIDKYKSFKNGSFIYELGYYQGNLLINEIERLNNIINELEKDSIAFKKLNAWIVNRHAPDLFHKMEIIEKLEELKDSDK